MLVYKLVSLIFIILLDFTDTNTPINESCRLLGDGGIGLCRLLTECLPLYELSIYKKKTENNILYLKQSTCGVTSKFIPKVCCPLESEWLRFEVPLAVEFPKPKSNGDPGTILKYNYIIPSDDVKVNDTRKKAPKDLEEFRKVFFKDDGKCVQSLEPPKLLTKCCGLPGNISGILKIAGGKDSPVSDHPWLALLEYASGGLNCAGSLISSRYVVTAAHCLEDSKPVTKVRLSEYNVSSYPYDRMRLKSGDLTYVTVLIITVERQIRHPKYVGTPSTAINDIGLVKLSHNAPYSQSIRPICLPFMDVTRNLYNSNFSAVGWGSNGEYFNEVRQVVDIQFVNFDTCQEKYSNHLNDMQFCAGGEAGKDTCRGDSGGPLILSMNGFQILSGIVSYGHIRCGTEGAPAIYTNVFKYLDWIKYEIK